MFFCRAANTKLMRKDLMCEYCPLYVAGSKKATEGSCAYRENGKEFPDFSDGNGLLSQALQFAAKAHKGAFRKGSSAPYILHPMEAAITTLRMTGDESLAAAAALHDVIEDTPYTYEDIRARFGEKIADIVLEESENKRRDMTPEESWKIRKEEGIQRIAGASREAKIVALSDKLSNMRATARDYREQGDRVFMRFHVKEKSAHAWYHRGLLDALSELSDTHEYREYQRLYGEVFGRLGEGRG